MVLMTWIQCQHFTYYRNILLCNDLFWSYKYFRFFLHSFSMKVHFSRFFLLFFFFRTKKLSQHEKSHAWQNNRMNNECCKPKTELSLFGTAEHANPTQSLAWISFANWQMVRDINNVWIWVFGQFYILLFVWAKQCLCFKSHTTYH